MKNRANHSSVPMGTVPITNPRFFIVSTMIPVAIQTANWSRPNVPIPMIFPIIKCMGFTTDTMISMIRELFSSATPCATMLPYRIKAMYRTNSSR